LKELQLIQILRINARRPVNASRDEAKAQRVNPNAVDAKRLKAVSGNADTAFRPLKMGYRRVLRFTAR